MRNYYNKSGRRKLFIVNQFALPRDQVGGTRHVDLYGELEGWDTVFIAGNINHTTGKRFTSNDARFHLLRIPRYSGNGVARIVGWIWFSVRATASALRSRSDVYIGSSPHPFAPAAALIGARFWRRPFVLEVRDLWPESIVAAGLASESSLIIRSLRLYERFLYRQASMVVGVTPGWQEYFADHGVPAAKFLVITNGTSASAFASRDTLSVLEERRSEHDIVSPAVVFAGSHGPKDGIRLILAAAAARPHVNFYLYGGGSDKEGAVKEMKEMGLRNVFFRSGVPKSELPLLLSLFDAGLHVVTPLPVFDRGMSPNKLFDYLAAGLPVVSNARIPLRRVIQDGQVGAITSPNEIAEGIDRVLAAPESLRQVWVKEGYRLASQVFSRESQKREVVNMLQLVADDA